MKQAKRILPLFYNAVTGMERTSTTRARNYLVYICGHMQITCTVYAVVIKCYSFFPVIWIFYRGNIFREAFYSFYLRVFNFVIFPQSRKARY